MKDKVFLFFIICSMGLIACSDYALMDQNEAIKNKEWSGKQNPEFVVSVKDTTSPYQFYLNLRNTIEYPFSNIFVLVHQQNPDKTQKTYRIKVILANREGLWLGKSAGNLFAHQVRFLKNVHLPDTGNYTFRIEHSMRLNPLPGINDVGLRIEPAGVEVKK